MDWEFSFLYFLQELHNPVLDKIMVFITSLGNDGLLWIGLAVVMLFFKKYRKCAISIGIAIVFKELLGNMILKELIIRQGVTKTREIFESTFEPFSLIIPLFSPAKPNAISTAP